MIAMQALSQLCIELNPCLANPGDIVKTGCAVQARHHTATRSQQQRPRACVCCCLCALLLMSAKAGAACSVPGVPLRGKASGVLPDAEDTRAAGAALCAHSSSAHAPVSVHCCW